MSTTIINDDPQYPTVIADEGDSSFLMRCPRCSAKLEVWRVTYRELVHCPIASCGKKFRIVTKKQIRAAEKRAKEDRDLLQRRIADIRRSGEIPPDRISIFGIAQSGKSVFLASLYNYLWNGDRGLSGRALHGNDHHHLLADFDMLASGRWIDATNRNRSFDLTIKFGKTKATLSSIDYPGEVFTDVFYRKRIDTEERIQLWNQMQSTMAAIILIDPEQVAENFEEGRRLDVEFTGIEVAEHLASRGMADHLVVCLTKRNQNKALVKAHGGPQEFVKRFLPRLLSAAPDAPVLHISAIGASADDDDRRLPTIEGFDQEQVVLPLVTLLQRIDPLYLRLLEELDRSAMRAANRLEDQHRKSPPPTEGKSADRESGEA